LNLTKRKLNLRQEAKNKRKDLSTLEIQSLSTQVARQVSSYFSFRDKRISCFLSMESQNEVQSKYILKHLASHNQLFVPVTNFAEGTMVQVAYNIGDTLTFNTHHIPEPSMKLPPILPTDLDVVFIPLLQADTQGNRLGYGKGFYDRYLALCRPNVIKIGLNFFEPIPSIPAEKTDIPLNYLITPNRVYEFK
jgi:5-formyltetrahydrofolate cyclo-ligase